MAAEADSEMPELTGEMRFRRLRELFDLAVELPTEEWQSFAREQCGNDTALNTELRLLLQQEQQLSRSSTDAAFPSLQQTLRDALPEVIVAGSQLGSYRVLAEIGSGGMGRVFRAERKDGDFLQQVAIKLLRQELVNPELLKRFSVERQLLAVLSHPGIARLIDIGEHLDGTPYLVMELVQGRPLLEHCDQRRLNIGARLQLFRKVLAAVSHAHQQLIVHRDIKSGNILIDDQGHPKLLDFGIAKALNERGATTRTATSDRYLSMANAAPEQLLGEHITVGCDVYALGTVLYEMLCGLPPFDLHQISAAALETQVLKVPPTSMTRRVSDAGPDLAQHRGLASVPGLRKALSGDLERIVQKCLRKAPAERYSSVEQLDEDIASFLANRPIRAGEGQRWYRMRKFVARNRLSCTLVTVLVLALGGIFYAVAARNVAALRERDRAQQALAILRQAFLSADPARVAGEDVTVRAVLDAAIPALEPSFHAQPDLYASLATNIAEVQLSIGLSTAAAELFDRADEAAKRGDIEPQEYFNLLVLKARAEHDSGDYAHAQESLARALTLGVAPTAEWQITKAAEVLNSGAQAEAVTLLRDAIRQTQTRTADDEWANTARIRLASALQRQGASVEALQTIEDMIAWQLETLPARHPRVTLARLQLAIQKRQMGRDEDAVNDARRIRADAIEAYGPRSPFAAKAAMVLGNVLIGLERYPEATELYREVTEIFAQTLGDNHPNTIRANFNLAVALGTDPDQQSEALSLYKSALAASERRFGTDSDVVVAFRYAYAEALIEALQPQLALAILTNEASLSGLSSTTEENRADLIELLGTAYSAAECVQPPRDSAPQLLEFSGLGDLAHNCDMAARLLSRPDSSAPTPDDLH